MKLFLILFSGILSANSFADCDYNFGTTVLNYTVTDTNSVSPYDFTVTRSNKGGSSCNNIVMGFSRGGSTTYNRRAINSSNGSTLAYNVYKTNSVTNILKSLTDASNANEVLTGSISKNQTTTFTYNFLLGSLGSNVARAGTYTDTVSIEAYPGTFGNTDNLEVTKNLAVNIIVPKSISISLVNTGGAFDATATNKTLDFGELTTNQELGLDVRVFSNAGYKLSVGSANNQVLQLTGSLAAPSNQIGYDFYFNGSLKSLTNSSTNPVILTTGTGVTPIQGVSFPIRVVIKDVDNKSFGTYQDYVTFTVATTE